MENLTEIRLTSDKIYSGCILDFYRDTVRLPNGGTAPRELTRHVGAVCIVPLLDDERVIVERQFRYPVNEVITEIPAGKRDSRDEAPDDAARRELREETGITARELIPLGPFYPAAAYSDEVIWMYLARGLTFGEQQLDDDEFLNLQAVPLEELARDVLAGRIRRGVHVGDQTQCGLFLAAGGGGQGTVDVAVLVHPGILHAQSLQFLHQLVSQIKLPRSGRMGAGLRVRGGVDLDVIKQSFIGAHNKAHSFNNIEGPQLCDPALIIPCFSCFDNLFCALGTESAASTAKFTVKNRSPTLLRCP